MNRVSLRIATRELAGGLSGFWVYLACIALGVFAIAASGSVTTGFSNGLGTRSSALPSAAPLQMRSHGWKRAEPYLKTLP